MTATEITPAIRNEIRIQERVSCTVRKDAADIKWIPFKAIDIVSIARMRARESDKDLKMHFFFIFFLKEQEEGKSHNSELHL